MSGAKNWIFTINNPTDEDFDKVTHLCNKCESYAWQEERGEKGGVPHIQGFACYKTRIRASALSKLLPRAFLKMSVAPAQAYDYCMKTATRLEGGRHDNSDPPKDPKRNLTQNVWITFQEYTKTNSWYDCCATFPMLLHKEGAMRSVFEQQFPNNDDFPKNVLCLWGKPGTGKSLYIRSLLTGTPYFRQNLDKWLNGYGYEKTLWIDDFVNGRWGRALFLQLLDPGSCMCEIKNGTVRCIADTIIMTSNQDPRDWFEREERLFKAEYKGQAVLRRMTTLEFTEDGIVFPEGNVSQLTQRQGNNSLPQIVTDNFKKLDVFFMVSRDEDGNIVDRFEEEKDKGPLSPLSECDEEIEERDWTSTESVSSFDGDFNHRHKDFSGDEYEEGCEVTDVRYAENLYPNGYPPEIDPDTGYANAVNHHWMNYPTREEPYESYFDNPYEE